MKSENIQARVYRLGKTNFAIAKIGEYFMVFKSVRKQWQRISIYTTFAEAKLSVFNSYAIDKGNVTI